MIKFYMIMLPAYCMQHVSAQNTFPSARAAGIDTRAPNASSLLEIISTKKSILIPRMKMAEPDAITLPAQSLLIFQTDNTPGFYYYTGAVWKMPGPDITTETDLQVGTRATNKVPKWNDTALVTGAIQDNGSNIGENKRGQ